MQVFLSLRNNSTFQVKMDGDIMSNNNKLLQTALDDPIRKEYGLNIILADENKKPLVKNWNKWQKQKQTDQDIKDMIKPEHINYGYLTGFNGLICIDFDAAWVYIEALDFFEDRLNTFTVKTPNGGYHSYFLVKNPSTDNTYKNTLHTEILGNNNTIVFGKAKTVNGENGEYVIINDKPILHDKEIIVDFKKFLRETLTAFDFLSYKCITNKLSKKVNYLSHDQRLDLSNLFLQRGASLNLTTNFFRMCGDFDKKITRYQLESTIEKIENDNLSYPNCDSLSKHFEWDKNHCNGCKRLLKPLKKSKKSKEKIPTKKITLKDVLEENKNKKPYLYTGVGHDTQLGLYYCTLVPFNIHKLGVILTLNKGFTALREIELEGVQPHPDTRIVGEPYKLLNERTHSAILNLLLEIQNNDKIKFKSISDIFIELVTIAQWYLDLGNQENYYVLALWIIASYYRPLFMWQGYLIFYGMRDVGKSTALSMLSNTCFNGSGTISGNKSESNLMRLAGGTHGLIIVDHYEEVKKNPLKNQTYVEFLENAWFKNATYERQNAYDHSKEEVFKIASSVTIGTRALNQTFHEKGIIITMIESGDSQYQDRSAKMDEDPRFLHVQKDLMAMALNYQEKVMESYYNMEVISGLGREFNKIRGLLSLANIIDNETEHQYCLNDILIKFAKDQRANRKAESNESEDALLRIIVSNEELKWTYSQLAEAMIGEGFENYTWQTARSELNKLQVVKKRDNKRTPVVITVDIKRAIERAKQRGIKIEDKKSFKSLKQKFTRSQNAIIDVLEFESYQNPDGTLSRTDIVENVSFMYQMENNEVEAEISELLKLGVIKELKKDYFEIIKKELKSLNPGDEKIIYQEETA